ncbi:HAMP domain-containing sensor histidine kinase [Methylibium sp.]|uniref:HAMP domain-containing sensor histidine kinase n=1 Tax=Methylibium sp. TaxID=2067992 RepID=UPI0017D237F4|nr:HAMP domain-containing sensor histidine kinase [Methylibium sp.]MBA3591775.1 HAMP domain-containing sensor histidine kinase [Methylibium sp.]
MSLRLKIHLIVAALVTLFLAAMIALHLGNLRDAVREEVVAANRVAHQLLNRTVLVGASEGTPAMALYLQGLGRVRSNEITLVDGEGRELYRSPPSPYKAGRDAPDWFERLVVPGPSEQSIAFPNGKMVVRADASRAAVDAWDQFLELGATALLLLLVVNAVVYWVVGRTVEPFGQIVKALGRIEAGHLEERLPPLAGTEAASIGAAFNRMVVGLRERLEAERRALAAESELSDRRELARWIDRHLEQERRLIARELHDELGQSVTAIRSLALSVAQRTAEHDPQASQAASVIADESSRLYDAMHGLIPRLAPLVLDAFGLADAMRDLVERTRASQPGAAVELQVSLGDARLGTEAALALYRAAQEGLTNALRHGQASHMSVSLKAEDDGARLDVRDDGRGLAPDWVARTEEDGGHYGLRWLAERVEALGGSLHIGNIEPRGAQLRVWMPFTPALEGTA